MFLKQLLKTEKYVSTHLDTTIWGPNGLSQIPMSQVLGLKTLVLRAKAQILGVQVFFEVLSPCFLNNQLTWRVSFFHDFATNC